MILFRQRVPRWRLAGVSIRMMNEVAYRLIMEEEMLLRGFLHSSCFVLVLVDFLSST